MANATSTQAAVTELIQAAFTRFGGGGDAGARILRKKEMSEKPILFSGEAVRAILNGSKTQTRRVVKAPFTVQGVSEIEPGYWQLRSFGDEAWTPTADNSTASVGGFPCPHGKPGDRLWVKEAWHVADKGFNPSRVRVEYAASPRPDLRDSVVYTQNWSKWIGVEDAYAERWKDVIPTSWCSPIFMPRWASRITLENENVWVERLQDISEEDAYAEGAFTLDRDTSVERYFPSSWDKINGKRGFGWDNNPLVWVMEFSKV